MKQKTKKFLTGAAALFLSLSVGAVVQGCVHAAIHPSRYGIDVFPSRQNHYHFAYQIRRNGHNSRVYYANRSSKIGRTVFGHEKPKSDYASYMLKHHPKWYRSIVARLNQTSKRTVQRQQARKSQRGVQKNVRKTDRRINRGRHSSRKRSKLLPSKFIRSNSQKALKRSGFLDARPLGGDFVFNKYAPNDHRAVVPKKFSGTNWVKGFFGQPNPPTYTYVAKQHGWKLGR